MTTATVTGIGIGIGIDSLALEITGICQLACTHCYARSSPQGDHGTMTLDDWTAVIDSAASLGVRRVQMIGGEPTLRLELPDLIDYALGAGLEIEVFTNLLNVTDRMWGVFARPGVRIATSYYSADPDKHDQITGRPGSHTRTRDNIVKVLRRRIPLSVSLIGDGGAADQAHAELVGLGVPTITRDRVRGFGRAAVGAQPADTELCGLCGDGRAAILPDGTLTPCVMGRWLDCGNVKDTPLADLLTGQRWLDVVGSVPRPLAVAACNPNDTKPCGPVNPPPDPNVA